jgi:hypothetical protein
MGKHVQVKHAENLTRRSKAACMPPNEETPHIWFAINRVRVVLNAAGTCDQAGARGRFALGDQRQLSDPQSEASLP